MNTKYALVNNKRTVAEKGLTGICPYCGSAMIAKCGNIRMKHWAHKAISECDSWSEGETEWHRQWKNHFDASWQEFIFKNETSGEKHIADVHTEHGLVIEFQHSPIDAEEQKQREQFYERRHRHHRRGNWWSGRFILRHRKHLRKLAAATCTDCRN